MSNVIVTAGPTYEPLDEVRRLTNHSTGRLGTELANHLVNAGFAVTFLRGYYTTFQGPCHANEIVPFTTTESLAALFSERATQPPCAIFHAAAVSDFRFGNVRPSSTQEGTSSNGKWSTRAGKLLAELLPTPKIIRTLRTQFPQSMIVGWKYEVDGNRATTLERAITQISENQTNYSVANGPAYGPGFGLVESNGSVTDLSNHQDLYEELTDRLRKFLDELSSASQ